MSTAQLKELADKLSAKESKWLSFYLSAKARASDPAWKTEMARRLKRMRAGHGITETEYRRRHPETSKRASAAARRNIAAATLKPPNALLRLPSELGLSMDAGRRSLRYPGWFKSP